MIFSNDLPASCLEGESIMYVDDDTDDLLTDEDPNNLHQKIQHKADCSSLWLRDNRMCVSGEKIKLLVMGTKSLKALMKNDHISIDIDAMTVAETNSEKLLGVTVSNDLT